MHLVQRTPGEHASRWRPNFYMDLLVINGPRIAWACTPPCVQRRSLMLTSVVSAAAPGIVCSGGAPANQATVCVVWPQMALEAIKYDV